MTKTNDVPMMFRAPIEGRCQLQRIKGKGKTHAVSQWQQEWTEAATNPPEDRSPSSGKIKPWERATATSGSKTNSRLGKPPKFKGGSQTRTYKIAWRLMMNSGQDEGFIRPVLDVRGYPYYPGSSMKGAFRDACRKQGFDAKKTEFYCGAVDRPGILRFHGGYPTNNWVKGVVDITHPQQEWQVKSQDTTEKPKGESAYSLISLYEPNMEFGISASHPEDTWQYGNWQEVWQVWETALGFGLGSRVSAGYGTTRRKNGDIILPHVDGYRELYRAKIKGCGLAPTLLDGTYEFRPNMFRATIRGHALRIFSGLSPDRVQEVVADLFGDTEVKKNGASETQVGLLRCVFDSHELEIYEDGFYEVSGKLIWLPFTAIPAERLPALKNLIEKLTQFAMLLGGFGKSWRRANHEMFWESYEGYPIGCHWEWVKEKDNPASDRASAAALIEATVRAAKTWLKMCYGEESLSASSVSGYREAWHQDNVKVWIRDSNEDSAIIPLLHGAKGDFPKKTPKIYQTEVTGKVRGGSQIGRLWHRMYPIGDDRYLEIVTLFEGESQKAKDFADALDRTKPKDRIYFQRVWPASN